MLAWFAGEIVKGVAVDMAKDPLSIWVRRMIKGGPGHPHGALALTAEQAVRVRTTVVEQGFQAGSASGRAALIADATAGALHVRP